MNLLSFLIPSRSRATSPQSVTPEVVAIRHMAMSAPRYRYYRVIYWRRGCRMRELVQANSDRDAVRRLLLAYPEASGVHADYVLIG